MPNRFEPLVPLPDLQQAGEDYVINSRQLWEHHIPQLSRDAHKYKRGHVLVLGGPEMTGAARLAARAAQRVGAGIVTIAVPDAAAFIYKVALESVLVRTLHDEPDWQQYVHDKTKNAFVVGPGMGAGVGSRNAFTHPEFYVIEALKAGKPCVLDADALTCFAGRSQILKQYIHPKCILTPHEGEFARLFADADFGLQVLDNSLLKTEDDQNCQDKNNQCDKNNKAIALSEKILKTKAAANFMGCVVLLKGADTIIAAPEDAVKLSESIFCIVNQNAPPWLATAGAGDVLAGMIAGLAAQGMNVFWAAGAAAHMHGEIAQNFGRGLIAEDIVTGIPALLK